MKLIFGMGKFKLVYWIFDIESCKIINRGMLSFKVYDNLLGDNNK